MTYLEIIEAVELYTGISFLQMKEKNRKEGRVMARYIAMYLVHKNTNMVYELIGNIFERDHSTIMHACSEMENRIFINKRTKKMVDDIEKMASEMKAKTPVYDIRDSFKIA